jgi:hypothetical protein
MEAASVRERSPLRLSPVGVAAVLLGLTLAGWILTFDRMRGMDAGPGTDLGGLGWFLGIWVTMMAAMMLPSVAPMVLAFARVTKERARRQQAIYVPTWIFLLGYLAAWTAYGLVAYGVFRVIEGVAGSWLAWDRAGPYVAGGAIVVAGLYQLTPIKDVCLHHCRTPLHFLARGPARRAAHGVRARAVLRRLPLGTDDRPLQRGCDEPRLDGRDRQRDLRREGAFPGGSGCRECSRSRSSCSASGSPSRRAVSRA